MNGDRFPDVVGQGATQYTWADGSFFNTNGGSGPARGSLDQQTSIYGVRLDISLGSGRFQSKMERLTERRAVPLPKGRPKRQGAA
jgi:hypothetical protein